MRRNYLLMLTVALFLLFSLTLSGVSAAWVYLAYPADVNAELPSDTTTFRYGTIYITDVVCIGGNYEQAESKKTADLDITSDIRLLATADSSAQISVTFYNNTEVSYYYNEAQTKTHSNDAVSYTVSGISSKEEFPAKSFKTVTVTFAHATANISTEQLNSCIHFNFVVDKESIGDVVAQTAVDRFRDILNNKVAPDSYDTLDTAMNNRGGLNKASAVTYIGNVSGSSSADSRVIQTLFGDEFMSMDLDGDGKAEPITMMIKRENLDNDSSTGASYTYSSWNRDTTVDGVEMSIYITAEDLSNVSSNKSVTVYVATFTKYAADEEWVQIVPLTKGTAKANNYSGYGSANSFNTDTWVSTDNKTVETLVEENTK